MTNVIIYARVSTPKQSSQGESLSDQIDIMRKYSKEQWWDILWEFQEQFTWTTDNRPGLQGAIESVKNLSKKWIKINYLVIHKMDRLTRWGDEVLGIIRNQLNNLGVEIRDVQWVFQPSKNVATVDGIDTTVYDWAMDSPSRTAESLLAMSSGLERKYILQRTIPREMKLSQEWYKIQNSNFGYQNKKVPDKNGKMKTIQVPDPIEWPWMIAIFNLLDEGYPESEVVDKVNTMGFKTRIYKKWNKSKTEVIWSDWGIRLTVKKLQEYISNPIYAGVARIKWRGNDRQYIKQSYPWLVSIELWNRVNKWRRVLVENENKKIELLSGKEPNTPLDPIKRRNRNNPEYPFGRLIMCDEPGKFFFWNAPKWRNGTTYPYYSATPIGKKRINVKKDDFEGSIIEFLSELTVDMQGWLQLYEKILERLWEKRKSEISTTKEVKQEYLKLLKDKRNTIIQSIVNISQYPPLLAGANEQLEGINTEIRQVEEDLLWNQKLLNIEDLKSYWKKLIENLWKIAWNTREISTIKLLFDFTFTRTPTYSEILNRNTPLRPMLALQSQEKIPQEGEFSKNLWWQHKIG